MKITIILAGTAAAALLAGCQRDRASTTTPASGNSSAVALLRTAANVDAGRATATDTEGGLRITLDARGLPAGRHGAHVHKVGRCDAPDFTTADAHWNPTERQHGTMNPQGPHSGDLPNLIVGNDGRGTIGVTIPGATLAQMLDADGAAMIVHTAPDDLRTDPTGNSGGRMACGVFQPA